MAFVDANIILEMLLPNRRYMSEVAELLGKTPDLQASVLTAHIVWYFGRLEKIADTTIARVVADYELLDVTVADYAWAVTNEQGKDFEDALQVSVATSNNCGTFLTLDKQLAARYAQAPLSFIIPSHA